MTYLVGTDIGTLGTKTVITDTQGNIQASTYREYGVLNPQQGWAEQWPDVWAEATYATIKEAVKRSKVDPESVVVVEKEDGGTSMRRLSRNELSVWLDRFTVGDLWLAGELGGRP